MKNRYGHSYTFKNEIGKVYRCTEDIKCQYCKYNSGSYCELKVLCILDLGHYYYDDTPDKIKNFLDK